MKDDYPVGYRKPPIQHRFKPGQSGNPGGRDKGSKNMATVVRRALEQKVVVMDGGRRRSVSKLEAACIQQSNKAAAGDRHALKLMTEVLVASDMVEAARQGPTIDRSALAPHYETLAKALATRLAGGDGDGE